MNPQNPFDIFPEVSPLFPPQPSASPRTTEFLREAHKRLHHEEAKAGDWQRYASLDLADADREYAIDKATRHTANADALRHAINQFVIHQTPFTIEEILQW